MLFLRVHWKVELRLYNIIDFDLKSYLLLNFELETYQNSKFYLLFFPFFNGFAAFQFTISNETNFGGRGFKFERFKFEWFEFERH